MTKGKYWIPAFAGMTKGKYWIPAFAGMTKGKYWIPAFAGMTAFHGKGENYSRDKQKMILGGVGGNRYLRRGRGSDTPLLIQFLTNVTMA
jgi:hypothetical protein